MHGLGEGSAELENSVRNIRVQTIAKVER
jgi:hypothetical protein